MTRADLDPPLSLKGWSIFAHPQFLDTFESLVALVERLRGKHPKDYTAKNPTKRLAAIVKLALEIIPQDPTRPEYRQGATLGDEYTHWFRAKFFQQYRLFFRYHFESRIIIYGWVNDESTKRAYESDSDAYHTFRRMLKKGNPPDNWNQSLTRPKRTTNGRALPYIANEYSDKRYAVTRRNQSLQTSQQAVQAVRRARAFIF